MISSRKQDKVTNAVSKLEKEEQGCTVRGVVCHVSKPEHRKNLIKEVSVYTLNKLAVMNSDPAKPSRIIFILFTDIASLWWH